MKTPSRWIALALLVAAAAGAVLATRGDASAQRDAGAAARRAPAPAARPDASARAMDAGVRPAAADAGARGASAGVAAAPDVVARPPRRGTCPPGMLLVEGEYCPNVEQRCLRWLEPEQWRCAEFAPSRCAGRRRHIAVCMDEFEYPNRRGSFPQVMVTWYAARRACENRGARLCTMAEWTFACEGEDMLPYPYGLRRDPTACNVDHQTMRPDRARLGNPATAADEAARLYEAAASGTYDRCRTPFGIRDMTGNVDEWVRNETGVPFQSALKGGWWGPIRGRCRPVTLAHNETFVYYQIGFRCCVDPS